MAMRANEYRTQGLKAVWHRESHQASLGGKPRPPQPEQSGGRLRMRKGSDNTLRVQGEGKRRGKHSSGAPVRHRTRPGTRCRLSSSRANSGVDAEWADRTGGGGVRLEKTARLRSGPGPLTCARGSEPGTNLPEAQRSRGGGGAEGLKGKGRSRPQTATPRSLLHT